MARGGGLETSLLQHLSQHQPNCVSKLTIQYRMNKDIMDLSNAITYDGRMQGGSEGVLRRRLPVPHMSMLLANGHPVWVRDVLNERYWHYFVGQ